MAKKPTIAQLTEALQRERADADNLRRRHEEQMLGLKDMIKASVVRELLPVIDNFERALKHVPLSAKSSQLRAGSQETKQIEDWIKGITAIQSQFNKSLATLGVERIKTVGEPFNPHLHEAISVEGSEGQEVVSEELQPGYKLGNDIIRHAMVKVKMLNKEQ